MTKTHPYTPPRDLLPAFGRGEVSEVWLPIQGLDGFIEIEGGHPDRIEHHEVVFQDGRTKWAAIWDKSIPSTRLIECPFAPGDVLMIKEKWAHDHDSLDDFKAEYEDAIPAEIPHGPYWYTDTVHHDTGLRWQEPDTLPDWLVRHRFPITTVDATQLADMDLAAMEAMGFGHCEVPTGPDPYYGDAIGYCQRVYDSWKAKHHEPYRPKRWTWRLRLKSWLHRGPHAVHT